MFLAFSFISLGTILIWVSAENLAKYSVISSRQLGISPFLIGSTVIAFGTSSPEIFTSFFAALENKGPMVVGNVIGSNVANLSLVFGSTILILGLKKNNIFFKDLDTFNLLILLISTLFIVGVILIRPFYLFSSCLLIMGLGITITYWYFRNSSFLHDHKSEDDESYVFLKLIISIIVLISAAWLITNGALKLLTQHKIGELFVGYTVLAIGTSLTEIAASLALALKGRHEALAGTLIGSNIFNGLFVLAIPGLMNKEEIMSISWKSTDWGVLLGILFLITFLFRSYLFWASKKTRIASKLFGIFFLSIYFLSLEFAFK